MVQLGSKNKKHLRSSTQATILGHHTDCGPMGLGQYNCLGEYCDPPTASSVFLIILYMCHSCVRRRRIFCPIDMYGLPGLVLPNSIALHTWVSSCEPIGAGVGGSWLSVISRFWGPSKEKELH